MTVRELMLQLDVSLQAFLLPRRMLLRYFYNKYYRIILIYRIFCDIYTLGVYTIAFNYLIFTYTAPNFSGTVRRGFGRRRRRAFFAKRISALAMPACLRVALVRPARAAVDATGQAAR